jgi:hypothetical protein
MSYFYGSLWFGKSGFNLLTSDSIVATLTTVPGTMYVGVADTIKGTVTPLTATVNVLINGQLFGTAQAIAGVWSLTAAPTTAMVGSGVVVTVSGDTSTANIVLPYVNPDISTWTHTNVTGSGTTEHTIVENTATGNHRVIATLVDVDDTEPYTWTIQVRRDVGTRNLRINDGGGFVLIDLSDGSVTESDMGCTVAGPDGEGFYTVVAGSRENTGNRVWCYMHNGSSVSYTGDGASSLVLRGVLVSQDTEATGGWVDGQTLSILALADNCNIYRTAQKISVVAASDPVVYISGVSLGFADWVRDGVYEVDWTPTQTDAVQISGDLSDTGEWTRANIATVTGDNSSGYLLTENSSTGNHRMTASSKILNHDSTLPLTVIGRVQRSVGVRNLRVAYGGGFITLDTSDGSQLAGTGSAILKSTVETSGWIYFEATLPANAGTTAWIYMTDGTTTNYLGDGTSALLVKDVAMMQSSVEVYAETGDGTVSNTHTISVIDRVSPPVIVPILLVLGQSNAVRLGGPNGSAPSGEATVYVIEQDASDQTNTTPTASLTIGASSAGSHGAGTVQQFVADVGAESGDYVGIIRWAIGGSDVVDDWDPSNAGGWWQTYAEPFIAAQITAIETAAGADSRVVGVIWHQGEGTISGGNLASWRTAVETVFSDLQTSHPFARFTIGEVHDQGVDYQTLNSYAQDIADADDLVRTIGLNDSRIIWDTDDVHLDTIGAQDAGRRLVRALGLKRE